MKRTSNEVCMVLPSKSCSYSVRYWKVYCCSLYKSSSNTLLQCTAHVSRVQTFPLSAKIRFNFVAANSEALIELADGWWAVGWRLMMAVGSWLMASWNRYEQPVAISVLILRTKCVDFCRDIYLQRYVSTCMYHLRSRLPSVFFCLLCCLRWIFAPTSQIVRYHAS